MLFQKLYTLSLLFNKYIQTLDPNEIKVKGNYNHTYTMQSGTILGQIAKYSLHYGSIANVLMGDGSLIDVLKVDDLFIRMMLDPDNRNELLTNGLIYENKFGTYSITSVNKLYLYGKQNLLAGNKRTAQECFVLCYKLKPKHRETCLQMFYHAVLTHRYDEAYEYLYALENVSTNEHLRKEYPNVTPLKDVNVTINKGDVISIIGPSGTGKSTLIRCINLLETPTSGNIWVDDQCITDKKCNINKVRQKMGMVFQSFNLFPQYTVLKNLTLARELIPNMEIHISTQASIVSAAAATAWHKMGAKRVVLARELSFKEIIEIRKKCFAIFLNVGIKHQMKTVYITKIIGN